MKMDFNYIVIITHDGNTDIETYEGNKWNDVYARLDMLRKSKKDKMKVTVIRGMTIENFTVKGNGEKK